MKIAYIPLKWDNIRNADMNKLYAIGRLGKDEKGKIIYE